MVVTALLAGRAGAGRPMSRGCDPLDGAACLLPWPNDYFTRADSSTDTGRRLDLKAGSTPATLGGKPMAVTDFNRSDGFSPGSLIITRVPGLNTNAGLDLSGAARVTDPGRYRGANQPIVVIDAKTGRRWPVTSELDTQASSPNVADLLIRPAVNFREGRRYIVALRGLKTDAGAPIPAGAAFRVFRDRLPSSDPAVNARRPGMERIFRGLKRAGIARANLYLAWDFTVASARSLAGPMLSMRDRAFLGLGDRNLADGRIRGRAPTFRVTSVQDFTPAQNAYVQRRIDGEVDVPCFLDQPGCPPGSRMRFDSAGLPTRTLGNVAKAPFICQIPRGVSGRLQPVLYGHGLFGSRFESLTTFNQQAMQEHGLMSCATDWWGMSSDDVPTVAGRILPDLSNFPMLADRVQQGMLNFLFVGRAMASKDGFGSDPAFQPSGRRIVAGRRLAFNGNSQGGIIGGALTAIAPDFTRSALGVPGINYSTLLDRSVDYDPFAQVVYANYARGVERPLQLALIQLLWDRGEGDGYAQHMTRDPYPNTPPHKVLLLEAFGDHQVTNVATAVEARTIGARAAPAGARPRPEGSLAQALLGHPPDPQPPLRRKRVAGHGLRPAAPRRRRRDGRHAAAADREPSQPSGRRPARPGRRTRPRSAAWWPSSCDRVARCSPAATADRATSAAGPGPSSISAARPRAGPALRPPASGGPRSRSRRSSPTSSRRQPWSVRVSGSAPPLRTWRDDCGEVGARGDQLVGEPGLARASPDQRLAEGDERRCVGVGPRAVAVELDRAAAWRPSRHAPRAARRRGGGSCAGRARAPRAARRRSRGWRRASSESCTSPTTALVRPVLGLRRALAPRGQHLRDRELARLELVARGPAGGRPGPDRARRPAPRAGGTPRAPTRAGRAPPGAGAARAASGTRCATSARA